MIVQSQQVCFSLAFPGFSDKIFKNSLTFFCGNFGFWMCVVRVASKHFTHRGHFVQRRFPLSLFPPPSYPFSITSPSCTLPPFPYPLTIPSLNFLPLSLFQASPSWLENFGIYKSLDCFKSPLPARKVSEHLF